MCVCVSFSPFGKVHSHLIGSFTLGSGESSVLPQTMAALATDFTSDEFVSSCSSSSEQLVLT